MLACETSPPPSRSCDKAAHTHSSDLQPAVGSREKEIGRVVGVGQLQHPLFETGLVSTAETHGELFAWQIRSRCVQLSRLVCGDSAGTKHAGKSAIRLWGLDWTCWAPMLYCNTMKNTNFAPECLGGGYVSVNNLMLATSCV